MSKIVEAIDRLLEGDMTPEARELLQRAKAVERTRPQPSFRQQMQNDERFMVLVSLGMEGGRSYEQAVKWAGQKWREGMAE